MSERFRTCDRLRRRDDFARVFETRCSARDRLLTVYAAANGLAWSRLGLSVSRRVGPATVRNYIRRRIREAFRRSRERIPKGFDLVCVAREPAGARGADLQASLIRLANKAASCSEPDRQQTGRPESLRRPDGK